VVYRAHALERMYQRGISTEEVLRALKTGKVIEEYPEDLPFPSGLLLVFVNNRPIHVVVAEDTLELQVIIITAYIPDSDKWENGFEKRRQS